MAAKKKAAAKKKTSARTTARSSGGAGLDAQLEALAAVARETRPSMPVHVLLQEAKEVVLAVRSVGKDLVSYGKLDPAALDALPAGIALLEEAESSWQAERRRLTGRKNVALTKEAERARREIVAAGRYFLEDDATAQKWLDEIVDGDGLEDLIDDLGECARFAAEHAAALGAADVEGGMPALAARATELGALLSGDLASARTDLAAKEAFQRRNAVAFFVEGVLEGIRKAARYRHRHQPEKLAPFRSAHSTRKSKGKRKKAEPKPS